MIRFSIQNSYNSKRCISGVGPRQEVLRPPTLACPDTLDGRTIGFYRHQCVKRKCGGCIAQRHLAMALPFAGDQRRAVPVISNPEPWSIVGHRDPGSGYGTDEWAHITAKQFSKYFGDVFRIARRLL